VRGAISRFSALATAAQACGRAKRPETVRRIWSLLECIDDVKYVGAKSERCEIMLRMVSAFLDIGEFEHAKQPIWKALIFVTLPGVLDNSGASPDDLDPWSGRLKRRKMIESLGKVFTGDSKLSEIRAKCRVLETAVRHFQERGLEYQQANQHLAEQLRQDVESASPTTWKSSSDDFTRDHAVAYCLLGSSRLVVGDKAGAEIYWQRARTLATQIQNTAFRAGVLAAVAEAYTRTGERRPAEEFQQQFASLLEFSRDNTSHHDRFLDSWANVHIRAGQVDAALALMDKIREPAKRFELTGSIVRQLAGTKDNRRCNDLVNQMLQSGTIEMGRSAARAWSKVVSALLLLDETDRTDEVQKHVLKNAEAITPEPERLSFLIAFVEGLAEQGQHARSFEICRETPDALTKGVLFAALLRLSVALNLAESDFNTLVNWTINTIFNDMEKDKYHFPLSLLITEQAISRSGKDAAIAQRIALPGSVIEACLTVAFNTLHSLMKRDGVVGAHRALNVCRLAADLRTLPPETLSILKKPVLETWNWFKAQASPETRPSLTPIRFVEELRKHRHEGSSNAIWSTLEESPEAIFLLGALPEMWERIRAVETLFRDPHIQRAGAAN
jgi:tetratricopeptide (TPR) repeat protein